MSWETAWEISNAGLRGLAEQIRKTNPNVWWQSGYWGNESFPFWAYASFGRTGVPGEEDVVVSLTFRNVSGRLVFSCDVALSDGQIVADGPGGVEPEGLDRGYWIEEMTLMGTAFLETQVKALQDRLCL